VGGGDPRVDVGRGLAGSRKVGVGVDVAGREVGAVVAVGSAGDDVQVGFEVGLEDMGIGVLVWVGGLVKVLLAIGVFVLVKAPSALRVGASEAVPPRS